MPSRAAPVWPTQSLPKVLQDESGGLQAVAHPQCPRANARFGLLLENLNGRGVAQGEPRRNVSTRQPEATLSLFGTAGSWQNISNLWFGRVRTAKSPDDFDPKQ